MTEKEFKALLKEVFNTHLFMSQRDHHTINELLYCLRNDTRFKDYNFNIAIQRLNGEWWTIPYIDAFVNIPTLSIWFDDDKIEYEQEYMDDNGYLFYFDNITIYEREG